MYNQRRCVGKRVPAGVGTRQRHRHVQMLRSARRTRVHRETETCHVPQVGGVRIWGVVCSAGRWCGVQTYTATMTLVVPNSMYADPDAWLMVPVRKTVVHREA